MTGVFIKGSAEVHTRYLITETSLSQPDSPTDASTSTLVGGSGLMGFSEWRLPGEGERPSRSRRSSRILDAITSPPRPCSVPRRSIPRRMSSLEERPQVLHNSHFFSHVLSVMFSFKADHMTFPSVSLPCVLEVWLVGDRGDSVTFISCSSSVLSMYVCQERGEGNTDVL